MRKLYTSTISVLILGVLITFSATCSRRPSDGTTAQETQNKAMSEPEATAPPPPVEEPAPQPIVVPAGTVLTIRTGEALSSKTSQTGQTFLATLAQPVSVGGRSALTTGSTVSGTVVTAKAKG